MTASRTALYRFFDADGDLLYVGISLNPWTRWKQHKSVKDWAEDVASSTIEWHDTREEALDAERLAIIDERPRYNVVHNRQPATGAVTRLADIKLRYYCWICEEPIGGGKGYVGTSVGEARRIQRHHHRRIVESHQPGATTWGRIDLAPALAAVRAGDDGTGPGGWRVFGLPWLPVHIACGSNYDDDPDYFGIPVEMVDTIGGLARTFEHQRYKRWFVYTDFPGLMLSAIAGGGEYVEPEHEVIAEAAAVERIMQLADRPVMREYRDRLIAGELR